MPTNVDILFFTPTSGSTDLATLQTYASSSQDHFGKLIYVIDDPGFIAVHPFTDPDKFYFNENGIWYASWIYPED